MASIMPYYSVPLTLDMENSAIGSKATLQDLLRDQMGFEGIIQTDWGMIWAIQEALGTMTGEEVSDEEPILIGVTQSRVDGIGGESIRLIDQMEQYTNEGKIDEDILTAAATRIVKVKFQMGVFENPYCDVDYAVSFVGNEESKAVNLEAARKAMTLLKNDGILPLDANAEQTILVCAGCQKRSHHAAFSDIIRTGDEDAKERSRAATSGRNVVHRYVGTQRTLAAEDRRCGKFRTYLRIGRRFIL